MWIKNFLPKKGKYVREFFFGHAELETRNRKLDPQLPCTSCARFGETARTFQLAIPIFTRFLFIYMIKKVQEEKSR